MKNIFIDTDMGNDDIMAIMMLLLSPCTKISAISVVNGVATKNNGYRNLLQIFSYLEIDIPIVLGYQQAIKEKSAAFPKRDILRANNLTLLKNLPINKVTLKKSLVSVEDFIYSSVTKKNSTILALGPLTNVAQTITKYGDKFTKNVKEIVLMGGGIKKGNVAPNFLAEYNMWIDPEAAQIVFSSKIPITMVGIDATDFVKVTKTFVDEIRQYKPKDKRAKILQQIICNNDNDFLAFYDPLVAYLIINPSIITQKISGDIEIGLQGVFRGKTFLSSTPNSQTQIVMQVNPKMFYNQTKQFMLK